MNDYYLTVPFESFGSVGGAQPRIMNKELDGAPMADVGVPAAPGASNNAPEPSQPAAPPKLRSLFPETWLWADEKCGCVKE
jgi:hypothetical protein